jgi:sterol desaturase/sphingolipid hydroxylase (fatty acid hydroxylase superfamily)
MPTDPLPLLLAAAAGAMLWSLAEYLLHRFAMHELDGRGIMSREHLEHHVRATWTFEPVSLLSWLGVIVVGTLVWTPVGWFVAGPAAGLGLGVGWVLGYAFYEYAHAMSHLRGPTGRYSRWLRRHHFHHHFGHPRSNHGVTTPVWDMVFGTLEVPERVRVPRRLVLPWLVDEHGELRAGLADDYELVGSADSSERLAAIDRARAFASAAPVD